MQLILHTGVHYTEQDRLAKTLLRNDAVFADGKVLMPDPDSYRGLMRDTLNAMHRAPLAPDARDVLLDTMIGGTEPERLILTDPNFFRTAGTALQKGQLYPDAPQRMAAMAQLFAQDQIQIYMTIRNPATLVPILHEVSSHPKEPQFWGGRGPQDLRWSELLTNIRAAAPEIPITVWCNEDMPLLWSSVVHDMLGVAPDAKIAGAFDLLMSIMSKEGMQRLRAYLGSHPQMSELQKRRVITAFLEKFALEDQIEEELDMLGWTEALVEGMTDIYDQDLAIIEQIPGVRVLVP